MDFDGEALDAQPAAFDAILAGKGLAPRWVVAKADAGRVLRQASRDSTSIHFPMAVLREGDWSDATASVRLRLVSGDVDRAGGIVMRYRDVGNYLVARINAAEGDLRIFRVVNGVRKTMPGAVLKLPIDDGSWHTLELRAEGAELTARIDGGEMIRTYDTYLRRGRIGLWTKADAVTEFDDLRVSAP